MRVLDRVLHRFLTIRINRLLRQHAIALERVAKIESQIRHILSNANSIIITEYEDSSSEDGGG